MIVLQPKDLPSHGTFICIYGASGVGKTVTSLMTLPKPVAWIVTEPRDLRKPLEAAGVADKDVVIMPYEDLQDFLSFMSDDENFKSYRSVFFDSLSYTMNIELAKEIDSEAYEARSKKEKIDRPIATQMKTTMEGHGIRNKSIFRILNLLGSLAASGKIVVVSCLEMEHPKFDRELAAAPALSGKEVPNTFPGFFDLIGRLIPNVDDKGKIKFPPIVSFESDGSYMAKFTGKGDKRTGPLNWEKLLKATK